jgi:hypothetical protein
LNYGRSDCCTIPPLSSSIFLYLIIPEEVIINVSVLPLSGGEIEKIRKLQSDWGVVTSEEEIDYVASFDTDFDGIVDRVAE